MRVQRTRAARFARQLAADAPARYGEVYYLKDDSYRVRDRRRPRESAGFATATTS
jgi:hypothetical protein